MNVKGCKIIENYDLKKLTTYKLDGKASYFASVNNVKALIRLINYCKNNTIKYKIIGSGANLIFQGNYDGVLIKLDKLDQLKISGTKVKVGAGYNTIKLSNKVMKEDLTGFEFASGIYGTIGGAIFNNAGAYKSDMGYVVKEVTVLTPNYEIKTMKNKEIQFHYRTSFFKANPNYIILGAVLLLKKGKKEAIKLVMDDRKQRRESTQPINKPCAGSVFRNPPGLSSWALIEQAGFKGQKVGDAKVSDMHANFIINDGKATGKDIIALINKIKTKIKTDNNIDLILEQEIVE